METGSDSGARSVLLAVVLDVTTKAAAVRSCRGRPFRCRSGRALLHLNPGVAFGMAGAWGGFWGSAGSASCCFSYTWISVARAGRDRRLAPLAGGLSNALERLLLAE
jgi:lipoprotein signal peptidase